MTKPNPQHRNTDSEQTNVIPPVRSSQIPERRKPVDPAAIVALVVLAAGLNWTAWLVFESQAPRVLLGTVTLTFLILALSNVARPRGGRQ